MKQEPVDDTDNQNMTARADDHSDSGGNEQTDKENNIQQYDSTWKENIDENWDADFNTDKNRIDTWGKYG